MKRPGGVSQVLKALAVGVGECVWGEGAFCYILSDTSLTCVHFRVILRACQLWPSVRAASENWSVWVSDGILMQLVQESSALGPGFYLYLSGEVIKIHWI